MPKELREAATALGMPRAHVDRPCRLSGGTAGIITGVLLAIARISGETAPLLFTALNNQFFSTNLNAPIASLPIVIFQFALSPYEDWQKLAWIGALIITFAVLALSITARALALEEHHEFNGQRRFIRGASGRAAPPHAGDAAGKLRRKGPGPQSDFFYGDNQALKSINVPLYERKVTAFIGPSGCGKSTLLRILNRIYDLYPNQRAEGEVLLDGENILDARPGSQPAARAHRHGVPEADAVSDVDLREHRLRHPPLREAPRRAELEARVESALRRAAIWDEVKDKLGANGLSLSGGQQQRLCIARTVAVKPEVILLDEPCSALDPISTAKIEELIDELKDDYTIAIVTHNMQQAARVSDYTAFMYLGELVEFDTTSKMFTSPADRRTQDYITGRFG